MTADGWRQIFLYCACVLLVTKPLGIYLVRANGTSIGLDMSPQSRFLWRTELRGFSNKSAIFPDGTTGTSKRMDAFIVSSLAVTF